jgi:hypothetical protein
VRGPLTREHQEEAPDFIALVMWRLSKLCMGEERVEYAEVGVAQWNLIVGEVE